jgi:TRAP-type mannitol/chloroaromatic compound transport system substrate-binding protein
MKRRQFLRTAGLGVAVAAVAKPAIAQSAPETKWRCTAAWPKSLDVLYGAAEVLAKAVAEATDNKFQIAVSPANEIVPAVQALEAVQSGTVEMAHTASYYYVGKDPTFVFGTAAPFGLNSRMQNAWQLFGGGMELMNAFYAKHKVYAIPCGNTGCQMGGWFRKEIRHPDDLKDLKMRIGGYAGRVMEKLGVVLQQVAGSELQAALEKGTIDAAEWVGPYDDEKLGLVKVAPYYYYPGWWEGGATIHNFINLDKWNALKPAYQSIVRTCCEKANAWMQAKYDAENPKALRRLLAAGAKLTPFSPAILDASLKAALDLYHEVSATNADFKKVFDAVFAFRGEQYLWWQTAEYGYDSFLIRNRTRV